MRVKALAVEPVPSLGKHDASDGPAHNRLPGTTVVRVIVFLLLATATVDGVARYVLGEYVGGTVFIYLPKIAAGFMCVVLITLAIIRGRMSLGFLWLCFIMAMAMVTGIVYVGSPAQVAFGAFIFVPFLAGILSYPYITRDWEKYYWYVFLLFGITVVGVILDHFLKFPWTGYSYQVGEFTVNASKEWYSFGQSRLAGFTRQSSSAAGIMISTGIYVFFAARARWLAVLAWLATG